MVSYYYTEADKNLVDALALEWRGRAEYDPGAKRGKRWILDGEPAAFVDLMEAFWTAEREKQLSGLERGSKDWRALIKAGDRIGFQAILAALPERIDYWNSDAAPF
jgi:hypothetical protein